MFFAAGAVGAAAAAAGTALDLLSSLTPAKSGSTTGVKQTNSLFDVIGSNSSTQTATSVSSTGPAPAGALSPSTFNALLSAQDSSGKASPSGALKDLFAQIDTNGDGKITKAEFEDKLGAGGTNIAAADNVFSKMDADGDGSVNLDEMATALKGKGRGHPHAHQTGGGADALMQALQSASSTSTTNSDGSITTTLTYADGSKITISQPAASGSSSSASSQYNLVERMVQRQADSLAAAAKQSVSVKI
ncbi:MULTISPECIES: EF-hand domain-containing protein [unclassified Afipia]|uniref:EF-hand domain-containing protein n=1 Tax=unclassified Afipia TaxID=2642050 RepID=UPI0003FEAACB|nr:MULTISPECIES: EF-hand domain-containing protein [unclassified Afipia]